MQPNLNRRKGTWAMAHPNFMSPGGLLPAGRPENCSAGGRGGGGGWHGCLPKEGGPRAPEHKILARKFFFHHTFSPTHFPPHMCTQNDQRTVGIILSRICWGRPPPPARQVGHPHPATPPPWPPCRRRPRGGGGWANGLLCHRPPRWQSNFLSAQALGSANCLDQCGFFIQVFILRRPRYKSKRCNVAFFSVLVHTRILTLTATRHLRSQGRGIHRHCQLDELWSAPRTATAHATTPPSQHPPQKKISPSPPVWALRAQEQWR